MANVTLSISGESQEVIAVVHSLANRQGIAAHSVAEAEAAAEPAGDTPEAAAPAPAYTWTMTAARDMRNNVSDDGQRLLDALLRAPEHQLHIDDIYHQLEMDRYGLIGARRSISAAMRRNPDTATITLLATKDRRVTLDSDFAQAFLTDNTAPANPMARWGQLGEYT